MKPEDFDLISTLVKDRSGLVLTKDKLYLLESRLVPLARKRGMSGLGDLVAVLRNGRDERLVSDVTEAMTTNESSFFRDIKPYEHLRQMVLPRLMQSRASRRQIRIWSAAASTGQEAYSIAISLREESAKLAGWRTEIVGTDLSNEVLEKARTGFYTQFEVQRGMPVALLMRYFTQVGEVWQIDPSIRAMVKFRPQNLLASFAALGAFDVVFCRNVLIYFDQQTKTQVLAKIARQMPADGLLFLGGAETVLGISNAFRPLSGFRGVYELTGQTRH